ncbi:hypothetical protein [Konateibacter massiliensis]|uniref:hypothetical protein n=1 Tax=Konateibacter massiliensis TaxID=2002841 RepID=UPI000C1483DC|nr:hypothetical protein [Konateibacter massiliensis]
MDSNQWMNNDAFKNIDAQKMMMLQQLMTQANGKGMNEMLPFLMAASRQSNSNGLNFTKEETQLIIEVLKKDMSQAEQERLAKILPLLNF